MPETLKLPCVRVDQHKRSFLLTSMNASSVVAISYVAARGETTEQGAVQRILNKRRITSIKEYCLEIGDFPNSIILNWISQSAKIRHSKDILSLDIEARSAQIIDGQHRVAGIREAIEENPEVGKIQLPVAIYEHLGTRECADIFLSINTEQKPVQKSLVFDLYGLASEQIVDPASVRARDIAEKLNTDPESPYAGYIKFPVDHSKRGGIALSTVGTAIKPLLREKGAFEQAGILALEQQYQVFFNFFTALQSQYDDLWWDKDNAFISAAGYYGAVDFLKTHLFDYCLRVNSFSVKTIVDSLPLKENGLLLKRELKGLGGAPARRKVTEYLVSVFKPDTEDLGELEF